MNKEINAIFELNLKVEATLTDEIESVKKGTQHYVYINKYEYISNEGIKYTGSYDVSYSTEEKAKAHAGDKIIIYIDGKGNSAVMYNNNFRSTVSFLIFGITFILASITIFIIFLLPHKWKPLPGKSKWVKYNP